MPPQPDLPVSVYDDSMLCRKFGPEVANYFAASPINRVSFLRAKQQFLAAAASSPSARFSLYDNLAPLCRDASNLAFVSHAEVKHIIGEQPFAKTEADLIAEYDSSKPVAALVLFMGLDERRAEDFTHEGYSGTPYFALDITPRGEDAAAEKCRALISKLKGDGHVFLAGRSAMSLNAQHGKSTPLYPQPTN